MSSDVKESPSEETVTEPVDAPSTPIVKKVPPEKSKVISAEDRLHAENLNLKMRNVQLQLQIMQSDLQRALVSRDELVKKMSDLRKEFLDKYGADLARIQIHEDGTFSPVDPGSQVK